MAKRVNKRFLILLTVAVVCGVGVLWGLNWYLRRGNTGKNIAEGDDYVKKGDYQKALVSYGRAMPYVQSKELFLKAGDCINELTRTDRGQLGMDVKMWERALEVDPNYVPALQRLMEALIDVCELEPRNADIWVRLREKAKKLAAADTLNNRAKAYEHVASINQWLMADRAVPQREIEEHLSALGALLQRQPDEPIIAATIAATRFRLARDQKAAGELDGAKEQREKAVAAFQEALKTQGDNPAILYRYADVQRELAAADADASGRPDEKLAAASRETLARAAQLVPKGHKEYYIIKIAWAQSLERLNQLDEAEDYLRQLLKDNPAESRVRLVLAQFLRRNPEKRNEAIELLREPLADDTSLKGYKAVTRQYQDFQRLSELTLIQIDACGAAEEKDRPALRSMIEDNLRQIERVAAKDPVVFKLRGYALLLDRDRKTFIEGIQLLEEAVKRSDDLHMAADPELLFRLARAYVTAPDSGVRQPGQARMYLQRLLASRPGFVAARKMLLAVLVSERQYEQARAQLAILEKVETVAKDDPDLIRARTSVMVGLGELDKTRSIIEALPDTTPTERLYKATAAQAAKLSVLAERLMRGLNEEEVKNGSKDYPGTRMLIGALLAEKKREEAINIVRLALAKDPGSARLKIMLRVLEGKVSPDELSDLIPELNPGGASPVTTAIQKAELHRQRGEFEEAFKVLLALESENPDDSQLLAAMFAVALDLQKPDVAARYAARLEKLNADHADGLYYRARMKLARRDFSGALDDATELTRKLESFASSWVVRGQAEQGLGRHTSAIASFSHALERQADNFEALHGLIECHAAIGQLANARTYIKQGIRTGNAAYFSELDRRFEERYGDPKTVTEAREQAARDNPEDPRIGLALVENYLRVSDSLAGKNDKAGALKYLAMAQTVLQNMLAKWPDDLAIVARLSALAEQQGKGPEALRILESFAARDKWKDKAEPWRMIAQHHVRERNAVKAEEALQKALSFSNNDAVIRQQLAMFYFQFNQPDKGAAMLKALADETKDLDLRIRLIELLVSLRRVAEAEAMTRDTLAKSPNDARLLALQGYIRMTPAGSGAAPNYDEAMKFIEQSLKLDPQNAPAHYYRGMIRLSRNELAGAVADLTAARNLTPDNADIRSGLFDALRRRGQLDEAVNELESAVQISPLRRDLRQKLLTVYFSGKRWAQAERVVAEAKQIPELAGDVLWWKIEAQMWLERGDLERAMAQIRVASNLVPPPGDPEVNYTYLDINLRKKDYDEVLAVTNKIIDGGLERFWWMWMCRAEALKGKRRLGEAEAAFDSALAGIDKLQDDGAAERITTVIVENLGVDKTAEMLTIRRAPYWSLCLVRVYATAQKWDKAVAVADEVRGKLQDLTAQQQLRAMSYLGQTYTAATSKGIPGAMEKAEQVYSQFLADAERSQVTLGSQLQALNNLAYLFAEGPQPNLSKALVFSKRAYDLMVKVNYIDPLIADTHGWVLILNNRLDEGVDILQKLTEGERPLPDAHYHLAEAYLKRSQFDEALASVNQARSMLKQARELGGFVDPSLEGHIEAVARKIEDAKKKSANPKTVEKNP
ncbi:MAG: tetratricopeptide repeat protein [Tepidisphaerales bacterium]